MAEPEAVAGHTDQEGSREATGRHASTGLGFFSENNRHRPLVGFCQTILNACRNILEHLP